MAQQLVRFCCQKRVLRLIHDIVRFDFSNAGVVLLFRKLCEDQPYG